MRRMVLVVILVLFTGGLVVGGRLLYAAAQPIVQITVEGEHDPVDNRVYVNGKRAYPQGSGGTIYEIRGKVGDNEIVVSGPFINKETQSIQAGYFDNLASTIKLTTKSTEQAVRGALSETDDAVFSVLQMFSDSDDLTIVGRVENSKFNIRDQGNTYTFMLLYSEERGFWKRLQNEEALSIDSGLPSEATKLFRIMNDD